MRAGAQITPSAKSGTNAAPMMTQLPNSATIPSRASSAVAISITAPPSSEDENGTIFDVEVPLFPLDSPYVKKVLH